MRQMPSKHLAAGSSPAGGTQNMGSMRRMGLMRLSGSQCGLVLAVPAGGGGAGRRGWGEGLDAAGELVGGGAVDRDFELGLASGAVVVDLELEGVVEVALVFGGE